MTFNSQITRTDAGALIPEEVSREIIKGAKEQSAVLQLAKRLPNMARGQQRMPVLDALAQAYFVNGDTGLKQTTELAWANKYINAEEVAVIVPIPDSVAADVDYDIWGEVRPEVEEAIGVLIDRAILFGTNAPASWPTNVRAAAVAAGNAVAIGTGADIYEDTMGEGGHIALLEADGFMATGHLSAMNMRGKLRGLRDANGQLLFTSSMQGVSSYALDGSPLLFPRNGSLLSSDNVAMFSGDWSQLVYSIRQDMTFKMFSEGVVTGPNGEIIYNLMQQDMTALRVVMRMGWQVPNPINRLQQTEANRYPVAVLTQ